MRVLIDLPKLERAAATMWKRTASVEEKQSASKVFLKYFVTYLVMLAIVGWGGSSLLLRFDAASPLGIAVAVAAFVLGLMLMITFTRALLRAIAQASRESQRARHG